MKVTSKAVLNIYLPKISLISFHKLINFEYNLAEFGDLEEKQCLD